MSEIPSDLIAPTSERFRRGKVELVPEAIADECGRPAQPYRSIDNLMALWRRGDITAEMWAAGEQFRADFRKAQLDPLKAADVSRPMVSGRIIDISSLAGNARKRVGDTLRAVGEPSGSCLWHVVGLEMTLQEWARTQMWGIGKKACYAPHL